MQSHTHTRNTSNVLDQIFQDHEWIKHVQTDREVSYISHNDFFKRFIIQHMYGTTYKVIFPISNNEYTYATVVNSVFELIEYVDYILNTFEKK